jgi:hypothetical protein
MSALTSLASHAVAGDTRYLGASASSYQKFHTSSGTVGVPLYFHTSGRYSSCLYGSPGNPGRFFGTRARRPYSVYQSNPWYTDKVHVRYETTGGSPVVMQVQSALAQRGYYHGAIDGVIGPMSLSAVRRYQEASNLRPTGMIDEPLVRSLGLR